MRKCAEEPDWLAANADFAKLAVVLELRMAASDAFANGISKNKGKMAGKNAFAKTERRCDYLRAGNSPKYSTYCMKLGDI